MSQQIARYLIVSAVNLDHFADERSGSLAIFKMRMLTKRHPEKAPFFIVHRDDYGPLCAQLTHYLDS